MRISRFPCLAETLKEGCVSNEELEIYTYHLRDLHVDMKTWFIDVFELEIPDWALDPLSTETDGDLLLTM